MAKQFPSGFSIGVLDWDDVFEGQRHGLDMYLLRFIDNYIELNRCYDYKVKYIYIDQELFFNIPRVEEFGIPIRYIPNMTDSTGSLQRMSHGTWIRPEDIEKYDVVDGCIAEFRNIRGSAAEQAYFRVYKEGYMDVDMSILFPDLPWGTKNYLIPDDLIDRRLSCRRKCEQYPGGKGCLICDRCFFLAEEGRLEHYFRDRSKDSEN